MTGRQTARIAVFCTLVAAIFVLLNSLLMPVWRDWHNFDTIAGFYDEPEETIEVIFLGASIMENAIDPSQLYEEQGICAYNLATERQPLMASYYWTREVARLHGSTLKAVVLDCSMLRRSPSYAFYQKALDGMRLSQVKLEAMYDLVRDSHGIEDAEQSPDSLYDSTQTNGRIRQLFPLLTYHDRWASLTQEDFNELVPAPDASARGFNLATSVEANGISGWDIAVPTYVANPEVEPAEFSIESLYYLRLLEEFCEQEGLQLILVKTPGLTVWGEANHNAVQQIASEEGLPFIDFNFDPYLSECGYIEAIDSADGGHMSWRGAQKLSSWMGEYLIRECGVSDVRNNEGYSFMEAELAEASWYKLSTQLEIIDDPAVYLRTVVSLPHCVTFVSVADDAASALTSAQRASFRRLGLTGLASLRQQSAYLCVLEEGEVTYQQVRLSPYDEAWQLVGMMGNAADEDNGDSADESVDEEPTNDLTQIDELYAQELEDLAALSAMGDDEASEPLRYEGMLSDGCAYALTSGGFFNGNQASIVLANVERAVNQRGINIVTYDLVRQRIVDSTCFDTCESSRRETWDEAIREALRAREQGWEADQLSGKAYELFVYLARCDEARAAAYPAPETDMAEQDSASDVAAEAAQANAGEGE